MPRDKAERSKKLATKLVGDSPAIAVFSTICVLGTAIGRPGVASSPPVLGVTRSLRSHHARSASQGPRTHIASTAYISLIAFS